MEPGGMDHPRGATALTPCRTGVSQLALGDRVPRAPNARGYWLDPPRRRLLEQDRGDFGVMEKLYSGPDRVHDVASLRLGNRRRHVLLIRS